MLSSVWYAVALLCVLVLLWLARQPAVHTVCDVEQCVVCCDTVVCVGVVRACTATRCTYCV